MNPIIVPVRNGLPLTRVALRTFRAQDIGPVSILVVDNASTDGTTQWLHTQTDLSVIHANPPLSVSQSWNRGLRHVFGQGAEYALVVNNDVELHPSTYRLLVAHGGGFVTAVGVREWPPNWVRPTEPERRHPDFSCYLIRKHVWDKVGEFDEKFLGAFCEDWDMHVRLHRAGVDAVSIDLPFLHHASQTVKRADSRESSAIQQRATRNREYFRQKHGVDGGTPEYYALFGNSAPDVTPPAAPAPSDPSAG